MASSDHAEMMNVIFLLDTQHWHIFLLENIAYEFIFSIPTRFARLVWRVCEIGRKLPYSCFFVGYCFKDLFKTTRRFVCPN